MSAIALSLPLYMVGQVRRLIRQCIKKDGIQPGCKIHVFEYGNLICLVPPSKNPIEEAMGCLPSTPSLSEEMLKERRKDFAE